MKERPILFSGPMVRALLDGTKTQTRRIVTAQSIITRHPDGTPRKAKARPKHMEWFEHQNGWLGSFGEDAGTAWNPHQMVPCPYGQPGDRLIVKEDTWMWCGKLVSGLTKKTREPKICWLETRNTRPVYCADHPNAPEGVPENVTERIGNLCYMWRKKIARFVPRWASRITLEITAVRVERLQDITAMDAIAEGTDLDISYTAIGYKYGKIPYPVQAYAQLWESINGPGSWDANPFVWVVEFHRIGGEA